MCETVDCRVSVRASEVVWYMIFIPGQGANFGMTSMKHFTFKKYAANDGVLFLSLLKKKKNPNYFFSIQLYFRKKITQISQIYL